MTALGKFKDIFWSKAATKYRGVEGRESTAASSGWRGSLKVWRGFTLIELLMVMTLMAIILSVAIAGFTGMGKGASMRAAVNNVVSTLSLARQYAITRRQDIYVTFMPVDWTSMSNAWYIVTNKWGMQISPTNELPAGVNVKEQTTVHFESDGTLGSGAMATNVWLVERAGEEVRIEITGLTGRIKVMQ